MVIYFPRWCLQVLAEKSGGNVKLAMNGKHQLQIGLKEEDAHIVQAGLYYKDITIWQQLIQALLLSGIQHKTETYCQQWLVVEALVKSGGRAQRAMNGKQQLEVVHKVLDAHIVQDVERHDCLQVTNKR